MERTAPDKKNDRRVRKTEKALKQALSTLLKHKSINSVSVTELTNLADINRGTFYLHYSDVYDLLYRSEDEILDELKETVNKYPPNFIEDKPEKLFSELYRLCLKNSDIIYILISENGDIRFLNRLKKLTRERFLSDWKDYFKENKLEKFSAYYEFIVGGCLSLIQYWFNSGLHETPEELARITADCLNKSALI